MNNIVSFMRISWRNIKMRRSRLVDLTPILSSSMPVLPTFVQLLGRCDFSGPVSNRPCLQCPAASLTHCVLGSINSIHDIKDMTRSIKVSNPQIKVILAIPQDDTFLGRELSDMIDVDGVMGVSDEEAFKACRKLAKGVGIMAGVNAGMAVTAAAKLARSLREPGTILTLLTNI